MQILKKVPENGKEAVWPGVPSGRILVMEEMPSIPIPEMELFPMLTDMRGRSTCSISIILNQVIPYGKMPGVITDFFLFALCFPGMNALRQCFRDDLREKLIKKSDKRGKEQLKYEIVTVAVNLSFRMFCDSSERSLLQSGIQGVRPFGFFFEKAF